MMSSTVRIMPCLAVLLCCARSAVWHCPVESSDAVAVPREWSIGVALYCSHMSAYLAGIKYAVCLHVLQAHDDIDVRRLENMRVCIGNMQA
jgi:hypothetical protein